MGGDRLIVCVPVSCIYIYTHTHTNTHTNTHVNIHTHTHTHIYTHIHKHKHIHTHTHTHTFTHTYTNTNTYIMCVCVVCAWAGDRPRHALPLGGLQGRATALVNPALHSRLSASRWRQTLGEHSPLHSTQGPGPSGAAKAALVRCRRGGHLGDRSLPPGHLVT